MKPFKVVKEILDDSITVPDENQEKLDDEPIVKKERKKRESKKKSDYTTLANNIAGIHQIAANLFGQPVLALDDTEATALANALQDVMAHHEMVINPVVASYISLAFVAGSIYIPRAYLIKTLKAQEKIEIMEKRAAIKKAQQAARQTEENQQSEQMPEFQTFDELKASKQAEAYKPDLTNFMSLAEGLDENGDEILQ